MSHSNWSGEGTPKLRLPGSGAATSSVRYGEWRRWPLRGHRSGDLRYSSHRGAAKASLSRPQARSPVVITAMAVHHDALLGVGDVDIRRGDVHRGGRPARVMSSLRPYSGGPERDSPTSQR